MRFVVVIFCLLFVVPAFAQSARPDYQKRVPRRIAKDPEKLAQRLTKGMSSDSEKVNAIYYWITHNIRYNCKKSGAYDFRRNSVESVLKRRRAICFGYSDLFNALCGHAGISSAGVAGFVKTRCQYDVGDTFYQEEHIWNAAEIDGKWYLFDATWDAGHVVFIRPGVLGTIVKIITFGQVRLYIHKPRFIADPQTNYFMRPGNYFAYDHLAGQPCFQLVESPITEDSFVQDSSFYFYKGPEDWRDGFDGNLENLRREFVSLDDRDQMIRRGEQAYGHYERNHFAYGISNALKAQKVMETFQEDGDSATEVRLAKQAFYFGDTSAREFDSALVGMKLERRQQQNKNSLKRRMALRQDKEVIKLARGNMRRSEHSDRVARQIEKYQKHRLDTDKKYRRNTIRNGFTKAEWAERRHNEAKRMKADSMIQLYSDSQLSAYSVLYEMEGKLQELWAQQDSALKILQQRNLEITWRMYNGISARIFACEDDLDYYLRTLRDTMLYLARKNDSALYVHGILYMDSIRKYNRNVMAQFARMHRIFRKEMTAFKRYKTALVADDGIVDRYRELVKSMNDLVLREAAFARYWAPLLRDRSRDFHKIKRSIRKGMLRGGYTDIFYEKTFYNGRKRAIRRHYLGISRAAKANKNLCKQMQKQSKKHEKVYKR